MTRSKYRYYLIIEKNINSVIVFFSSLLMLCIALVSFKNVPYYIIFGKTVLLLFLYAIRVLFPPKKIRYSVIDIILLLYMILNKFKYPNDYMCKKSKTINYEEKTSKCWYCLLFNSGNILSYPKWEGKVLFRNQPG